MEHIQDTIENAIKLVAPFFKQSGEEQQLTRISQQIKACASSSVCLLVCGEFKRGKSTFVNALIGRNLCATDTDICTSVVSIIKYAPQETVTRYYGDFSEPKEEKIQLNELEKYTVGTAEEIDNTLYVEIGLPLPSLKDGLVIIDTPGVGGLDPRHATLTNYFLPRADIALFMTDVNEPITTTELTFLKNKVLPYTKQSAVIVNKADLRDTASVEDIRQDTINKIISFTQVDKENIPTISVSSAAEAYPETDLGDSNFSALRAMIFTLVEKHRRQLRASVKADFIEMLNLAIEPLQVQLRQIEQPDINQIDELNSKKALIDRKLTDLADPASEFRSTVNKEITRQREEISNFLNEAAVTLQADTFNNILHSPKAREKDGGQWMGMMLNDAIAEIGSELTLRLNMAFSQIAAHPQFEGMLRFELKEYNSNIVIRDVNTDVPMNKRITPLMTGVGIASVGCFYVATGFLGVLASLGVAAYVAIKNSKDTGTAHIESNLRQVYQPQMSGAINSLTTYVNTRFTEFQQEWLSLITERCKAYQKSLQESVSNIQQLKQLINQSVTLRVKVQNQLKPLLMAREIAEKATI